MSVLFYILSLIALGVVVFLIRYGIELAGPVGLGLLLILWGIGSFIFPLTMPFMLLYAFKPWGAIVVIAMGLVGVVKGILSAA